jgi:hypothetical protein
MLKESAPNPKLEIPNSKGGFLARTALANEARAGFGIWDFLWGALDWSP